MGLSILPEVGICIIFKLIYNFIKLIAGHEVIAIDNFANAVEDEAGSPALQRAERITGKNITFYKADLLDKKQINDIFDKVRINEI